jgi:DNA repair protein RadC
VALLRRDGPSALSTERLLQAVLSLSAEQTESWRARLAETSLRSLAGHTLAELAQWCEHPGAGPSGGAPAGALPERLHALFELARRFGDERLIPGVTFRGAEDVFQHFHIRLRDTKQERFFLILLDSRRRFLGEVAVSQGTIDRALVHPRDVFGPAVRQHAGAIVVVHNHPSGDPAPSPEDINVTKRLAEAGAVLGIPLLDHVVIGEGRYVSFAEKGLMGTI